MIFARTDYDRIQDPAEIIPDDEPVFLLRGQDPAAAETVRAYAAASARAGADPEMVAAVRRWAARMEDYAKTAQHGAPDVPDGMLR